MAREEEKKVIVVVRERKRRGGYQSGGSWKVAYADFVTAMMAFFLVLWILGMDPEVRDLIQGYFNNPVGYKQGGGGANILGTGNSPVSLDATRLALLAREQQRRRFEEARHEILRRLEDSDGLRAISGQVEMIVTDDGLRIELIEGESGSTFFEIGSALLTPPAAIALAEIGDALSDLPNEVKVEGHTDSRQYSRPGYTNWELSADRANAARRALEVNGIDPDRVIEVRGYADRELRNPADPRDPSNRRVTILLPFSDPRAIEVVQPLILPPPLGAYGD